MWIAVTIIVVLAFLIFLYNKGKQVDRIVKEGGMSNKYKTLIDLLLSGDPRSKIHKVNPYTVVVGLSNIGGKTMFYIIQKYRTVIVKWKVNSPIYGNHSLDWEFDEYMNQEEMVEKISHDLNRYQTNMMTTHKST